MSSGFKIIKNNEIKKALEENKRQYLVGDLQLPQQLKHIADNNLEVGITEYKEYEYEKPHYHTTVNEYQYVLKGECKYIDLNTKQEYLFKEGDFFVINTNTPYIQKSKKGTKIFFFKVPGINDKIEIEIDEQMQLWCSNWNN